MSLSVSDALPIISVAAAIIYVAGSVNPAFATRATIAGVFGAALTALSVAYYNASTSLKDRIPLNPETLGAGFSVGATIIALYTLRQEQRRIQALRNG